MSLQLEPRHERFCQEYSATLNATRAALKAGYSPKSAKVAGPALLKRWHIQQRIDELNAARAARTQITGDRIDHELAKLGFANMADYVEIDAEGQARPALHKVTRDQLAALQEVQVQETVSDTKHGQTVVTNRKLKLADKRAALETLAKRRGLLAEKHDVSVTGTVQHELSPREAARRIAFALTLGLMAPDTPQPQPVSGDD